jgi:hypothetical protein
MFLFLSTASPLLLDITRQARGYGLAFLAMSVVVVAALEANRTHRVLPVAVLCVAGVLGAWTLPQLSVGFLATVAVLALDRSLRVPALVGLAASVAAIAAWYAPHLGQVQAAATYPDGRRIHTAWLLTAPFDQILSPALLWIEGVVVIPGALSLMLALAAALFIAASPLARRTGTALILTAGPVATVLVLWIGRSYVIPRYLSFLLVPMFVLLATGAAAILGRFVRREAIARGLVCVAAIAALALNFAHVAPTLVILPKEATRDAADVIGTQAAPGTPVFTRLSLPQGLIFYLGRPVRALHAADATSFVCTSPREVAYVMQPFSLRRLDIPCLRREGVRHFVFKQYTRGDEIDVWLVPPR